MAEEDGLDALSMRRLAQELDVWPMAVYRYFRDKDALLDAMVDTAAARAALPDGSGEWREELRELLESARGVLSRYTGGLGLPVARALLTPSGLRMSEAGIRALAGAGLDPEEAARAWRALFSYAVAVPSLDGGEAADAATSARVAIAGLSREEYPALAAAAEAFASAAEADAEFRYGLERLLDGLEARTQAGT